MTISVFDLFSIGIGPSSSHTVGPMRAVGMFVDELSARNVVDQVVDVRVDLYGSLAATGGGHGTMPAILLGLEGYRPDTIETDEMERRLAVIRAEGRSGSVAESCLPSPNPTSLCTRRSNSTVTPTR